MPMNRFTNLSDNEKLREVIRFGIVGVVATIIQYACYLAFNRIMHPTLANTIAKVKSTTRRGLGFAFSHLVNYTMQTVVLATMLFVGIPKDWAMVPVFAICVPVNFILVRYFLKK